MHFIVKEMFCISINILHKFRSNWQCISIRSSYGTEQFPDAYMRHLAWMNQCSKFWDNSLYISSAILNHHDVIKWKHFPCYWPFVRGIHPSPVNSPHRGQWCGALMFSLICAWMNGWVNNREAVDLRHHRAHCDVTVMLWHMASKNAAKILCLPTKHWKKMPSDFAELRPVR